MNKKYCLIFSIISLIIFQSFMGAAEIKQIDAKKSTDELPEYFCWSDVNGIDFTTPVKMQQPYASCESFAYVAAIETMVQIEVGFPFNCDLSEAHLFFWSGGNTEWGSYPENDTNFLVEHGVPDEACWPYPSHLDEAVKFPKNTTCPNWMNRTVKVKKWSYLPPGDIDAIKNAIVNNGPVPAHFHVYKDFTGYKGGVYQHRWGKSHALHLMCIMGYQDDSSIPSGGYWIVKNSWGTHLKSGKPWGEDGWVRIAYGEGSIEQMAVLFEDVYGQFPILYVDDSNTIGPWDGSKEYPYQTINKAIDKAYPGWTIYVKNGTYNENLIIDKKLYLKGENPENTIVDGNNCGIVVYVKSPNVKISELTIQNSGNNLLDSGIRTLSLDTNLKVENCIIKDNDVGLYLNCADFETYQKTKNIVEKNKIYDNRVGIFTTWVEQNHIDNNKIYNNSEYGIEMEASRYSTIADNEIKNNKKIGIFLHGACDESNVENNNITDNDQGLIIKETKSCTITKNNFIDNSLHASFIRSWGNKWTNNYWSDGNRFIPRPISGTINLFNLPWINFDWNPSSNKI